MDKGGFLGSFMKLGGACDSAFLVSFQVIPILLLVHPNAMSSRGVKDDDYI